MKNIIFLFLATVLAIAVYLIIKVGFSSNIDKNISFESNLNDVEKIEFIELYRKKNGEDIFYELEKIFKESSDIDEIILIAYYFIKTDAIYDSIEFKNRCLPIFKANPTLISDSTSPAPKYFEVNEFINN